uniref:Uncharacterized protein n=1 Tax=Setaria italica TaxID=4555 RepID=K4AHV2_SETIT
MTAVKLSCACTATHAMAGLIWLPCSCHQTGSERCDSNGFRASTCANQSSAGTGTFCLHN